MTLVLLVVVGQLPQFDDEATGLHLKVSALEFKELALRYNLSGGANTTTFQG